MQPNFPSPQTDLAIIRVRKVCEFKSQKYVIEFVVQNIFFLFLRINSSIIQVFYGISHQSVKYRNPIRPSSGNRQAIKKKSSQSSDVHQTVIRRSSDGHQTALRQPSDSPQTDLRQWQSVTFLIHLAAFGTKM